MFQNDLFSRFWHEKLHYFEKLTFLTLKLWVEFGRRVTRNHANLFVRPAPSSRTTWNIAIDSFGKKRSLFWEIDISYTKTGVEFGRRVTRNHANLSGRPGPSSRTRWNVAIDSFGEKRSFFLTFWLGTKCNYFEKLTIRTLKQGSSLVVAWPATMKICPVGPDPVHVQDGMSRLTVSGRKGHFFEILTWDKM